MEMAGPRSTGDLADQFTTWYVHQLQWVLPVLGGLGLLFQLSLSFALAPRAGRSRGINAVYVGATAALFYASQHGDIRLSALIYAWIGPGLLISTRLLRAMEIARGSAQEAAMWLSLGRDRPVSKCVGPLLMGLIVACSSVGQPPAQRLGMMVAVEACRLGIVLLSTLKAGSTSKVVECARFQVASGLGAYAGGAALATLHEVSVRRLWMRNARLEHCTSMQALDDQQCLLDLYSGVG